MHPITANVYAVADCSGTPCPGALLATVTQSPTIPYRPSKDPVKCTGANAGKWFDPLAPGGGQCRNYITTVLTFPFPPGTTLPNDVIWTVAFNTTHFGAAPIGTGAACFGGPGGCPYDSLNVAAQSFPGQPYAGIDVNPNGAFVNYQSGSQYCLAGSGGTLRLDTDNANTCWFGFTPLGEIITTP